MLYKHFFGVYTMHIVQPHLLPPNKMIFIRHNRILNDIFTKWLEIYVILVLSRLISLTYFNFRHYERCNQAPKKQVSEID